MRKKLTNEELSRICQKWHCNPSALTEEELELLPLVAEWERDVNYIAVEEDDDNITFEDLFEELYGLEL